VFACVSTNSHAFVYVFAYLCTWLCTCLWACLFCLRVHACTRAVSLLIRLFTYTSWLCCISLNHFVFFYKIIFSHKFLQHQKWSLAVREPLSILARCFWSEKLKRNVCLRVALCFVNQHNLLLLLCIVYEIDNIIELSHFVNAYF